MSTRNVGGRPKKLEIKLSEGSLEDMVKNIWHEAEETKLKAIQQYNKQIRNITDNSDIALIGKTNADYLKIVNDCTEKKLSVAKIVHTHVKTDTKSGDNKTGAQVMTSEDKKQFAAMMKAQLDSVNENYENQEDEEPRSIELNEKYESDEIEKIILSDDFVDGDEGEDITNAGF